MAERLLLNTGVLIEYLRGRGRAVEYLEGLTSDLYVSVISIAELFAGARGEEEEQLKQFLLAFSALPVTETTAWLGGRYRRDYGRSHGTGLAGALIAATAEENEVTLVTFNQRHFPMVEIRVPYERWGSPSTSVRKCGVIRARRTRLSKSFLLAVGVSARACSYRDA